MEALLLASGMLLAYQYAHRRYQLQGAEDPSLPRLPTESPQAPSERCLGPDGQLKEECQRRPVKENGALHMNENMYYRHDVRHKAPLPDPAFPAPIGRPPRTITNPAEQEMIREFRAERPATLSMGAAGNTAYRPSWMRADDAAVARQERVQEFTTEMPRLPDGRIDGFYDKYRTGSMQTIGRFGQGGLPFADQERVIPDGLDPVATNRTATARYHQYALGDDLTQNEPDRGLMAGVAQGQARGRNLREETWEVMPSRQLQMAPTSQQTTVATAAPGTGVRSGGRGAPLGALLGQLPDDGSSGDGALGGRPEIEWDVGPTGNKFPVQAGVVRPVTEVDAIEDVDAEALGLTAGKRAPGPLRGPAMNEPTTSWKFSFDLRKLMDLTTGTKIIKETAPDKQGIVTADHRQATAAGTQSAAAKKPQADAHPKAQGTGTFGGLTVFKAHTSNKEKGMTTSSIRSTKRSAIETAFPSGSNMSGRTVHIKKSDATTKRNAVDDGVLKGNDIIYERAGKIAEPRRAPKSDMPDYAQPVVSTMRKPGEFRRR
jgi:hypothetical protein